MAVGVVAAGPAAAPGSSNLLLSFFTTGGVDSLQPDTGARQNVLSTNSWDASYTPDGTRLVYIRSGEIVAADGDGKNAQVVDDGTLAKAPAQPSLSPDGTHVVFVGDAGHLYVASVEGHDVHQITGSPQTDERPSWSPRGDAIVFTRRTDASRPELYVVGPTGGDRQISFGGEFIYSSAASWSPDGGRLAFIEETAGGNHVAVMNADGTGRQAITQNFPRPFGYTAPVWSPDGARIAFMEQPRKLDVIDVDRQNWNTLIPDAGAEVGMLSWRPIGAGVAVDVTEPDSLVARRPLTITGTVRSLGLLPATNVAVSIAAGTARVTKATLGGGSCQVSAGTAMCTASSLPGDTEEPLSVTLAPTRPGKLTAAVAATASNDANKTDDQASAVTSVSACTVLGTEADDQLRAKGGDLVCGLGGSDRISARNGKVDTIDGGPGIDTATVDAFDHVRHVEHVLRPKPAKR